jgi:hypothetical protein
MKLLISTVAIAFALAGCAGMQNEIAQNSGYETSLAGNLQAGCPVPVDSLRHNPLCYAN